MSEQALIGTAEAAALVGVSQRRVQAMIHAGQFKTAQRIGSTWVIERREAIAIASKTRPPGRPKGKQ